MKTIRRLYFYLVAFVSLEVVAWALISLARSIFTETLSDILAGGLAFILVGLPVFLFHWRVVQRDAAAESEERFSGVRATFLYGAWLSLAIPVVQNVLAIVLRLLAIVFKINPNLISVGGYQGWADNLIAILINAVLAAYILSILKGDWEAGPPDEAYPFVRSLNRYLWVLYGLGMTIGGVVQLIEFILDGIRASEFRYEVVLVNALGFIVIGIPLWLYSWKIAQEDDQPSVVRTVTLYGLTLLGALAALLATGTVISVSLQAMMSKLVSWSSVWWDLKTAIAVLLPAEAVWAYHWSVLKRDIAQDPSEVRQHARRRLYFYLLSLAGLVATFITLQGLVTILVDAAFCQAPAGDIRSQCGNWIQVELPNVIAVLLVSVPVWVLHWRPAQSRAALESDLGESARGSLLRRGYLYLILFAGVIGSMVSTGWLLYELISNLLGIAESNSLQIIFRILGTLVLFLVFTYYHWRLLRQDGKLLDETLAERQRNFPVAILSEDTDFTERVQKAMSILAPNIPVVVQAVKKPLAKEIGTAKAAILQTDTLVNAGKSVLDWLQDFDGKRIVLPSEAPGWIWLGFGEHNLERQTRQAVKVVQQLAEAGESKGARSLSPGTVVGYVIGVIIGLIVFCMFSSAIIELFN
jgi:hypothetical protein